MAVQTSATLKRLQRDLPEGLVVDVAWLERKGYSSGLCSKYVARGLLEQVARGVYRRPRASVSERKKLCWQDVVISLQTLHQCPITIGGRTALELQGFVHNRGACGVQEVHLYGSQRPPAWVARLDIEAKLFFHDVKALFNIAVPCFALSGSENGSQQSTWRLSLGSAVVRQDCNPEEWALTLSTPERAILEMLDEVTQPEALHQADSVIQRLRNLRPKRLQKMLVECRNVEAKHLFLWFAERHNHEWLKHLDREEIDLGAGTRSSQRGELD